MEKKDLRIVYMGTPDFAVEPLKKLVEGGYNVVGCITMPDKPAGRGHKIQFSPVKEYAIEKGIPLLQPEKLKDETFQADLKAWNADLQIVVAFRMLPESVWNMPRLGTFNLHASLLPQYRGAAPINWAVINGEKETGVTTFFLTHDIDTGNIILQEKIKIDESDNVGTVHDRLMTIGAELVTKTVDKILDGSVTTTQQSVLYKDLSELKPAPKIFKETCKIDFNEKAQRIHNLVRGLSPYPAAWCELLDRQGNATAIKVFETEILNSKTGGEPGTFTYDKKSIDVTTGEGTIRIKTLQYPGKKRLSAEEFLRGFKMDEIAKFN
ncbi:MAG: methionyl-tRNA formyltransferase [Paludibacteraceae bacterium]|nr:methionyl-tRNA formyltransferase [Paludibacteraceae bacterium]MBP5480946.1 methionyl-tRNA formyltransferase [Paludibacteraceae bacterium]